MNAGASGIKILEMVLRSSFPLETFCFSFITALLWAAISFARSLLDTAPDGERILLISSVIFAAAPGPTMIWNCASILTPSTPFNPLIRSTSALSASASSSLTLVIQLFAAIMFSAPPEYWIIDCANPPYSFIVILLSSSVL